MALSADCGTQRKQLKSKVATSDSPPSWLQVCTAKGEGGVQGAQRGDRCTENVRIVAERQARTGGGEAAVSGVQHVCQEAEEHHGVSHCPISSISGYKSSRLCCKYTTVAREALFHIANCNVNSQGRGECRSSSLQSVIISDPSCKE